jgi:hypothetical protein
LLETNKGKEERVDDEDAKGIISVEFQMDFSGVYTKM